MFRTDRIEIKENSYTLYSFNYVQHPKDQYRSVINIERYRLSNDVKTKLEWSTQVLVDKLISYDLSMEPGFNATILSIKGVVNFNKQIKLIELDGETGNVIYDINNGTNSLQDKVQPAIDTIPEKHKQYYVYRLFSAVSKYINKGYSYEAIIRKIQYSNLVITATDNIDVQRIMMDIINSITSTDTVEEAIGHYIQKNFINEDGDYADIYQMLKLKGSMSETYVELNTRSETDIEVVMRTHEFIQYLNTITIN